MRPFPHQGHRLSLRVVSVPRRLLADAVSGILYEVQRSCPPKKTRRSIDRLGCLEGGTQLTPYIAAGWIDQRAFCMPSSPGARHRQVNGQGGRTGWSGGTLRSFRGHFLMPSGTSARQNPLKSPQTGIGTILHSGSPLDRPRTFPSIAWGRDGRYYLATLPSGIGAAQFYVSLAGLADLRWIFHEALTRSRVMSSH
jgi:hypothetical protein